MQFKSSVLFYIYNALVVTSQALVSFSSCPVYIMIFDEIFVYEFLDFIFVKDFFFVTILSTQGFSNGPITKKSFSISFTNLFIHFIKFLFLFSPHNTEVDPPPSQLHPQTTSHATTQYHPDSYPAKSRS